MFARQASLKEDPNYSAFVNLFRRKDGILEMNKEKIMAKYEELNGIAKGGHVEVSYGEIRVPLGFIWWNRIFPLGRFTLVMSTKGEFSARLFPSSKMARRLKHFTAFNLVDGGVCFGNIGGGIKDLIQRKEYALATFLVIRFLQTVSKNE